MWDIALPSWSSRVVAVTMAGFRDRAAYAVDLAALPYPAVTVVVEFGEGPLIVVDDAGREQPTQGGLQPRRTVGEIGEPELVVLKRISAAT